MYYYSPSQNSFLPIALKKDYVSAGTWPEDVIEVADEVFAEFADTAPPGQRRVAGPDGLPAWEDLPPPTPEQIEAQKVAVVQGHMDNAARELRYDDIKTAVTYAEEPAVPKFQAEGQAFRAWRSEVWAKCYAILADVKDGKRDVPTDEELIAELPDLVLPE